MSIPSVVSAAVRRRRHSLLLGSADYTGSTLTSSVFALTANGSATTTLEATVYKNGVLASGETVEFTVERITVGATNSFVGVDPTVFAADGVASTTITVQANADTLDSDGNYIPLPGIPAASVVIASTGSNNTLTQPASATDADGATTGLLKTTTAQVKTITATVAGLALTGPASATADAGGTPPVTPPSGDPFFEEDFTGTQFNPTNGFTWGAVNDTAVVSYLGDNVLEFTYEADLPGGDSNAEQRFALGRDCADLWVQYDLLIPADYDHRNDFPSNNKFFLAWRDTYGSGAGTWQPSFEIRSDGAGGSTIRPMSTTQYRTAVTSNAGTGWSNPNNNKQFIANGGPVTPGTWAQIRVQFSASSAADVQDGVMRLWVDGVLFAEATGVFRNYLDSPSDVVLRRGYFLGWANSGFDAETKIRIKTVKFYDSDPGWS